MRDELTCFTVYKSPRDYPGFFVARKWTILRGEIQPDSEILIKDETLAVVRAEIHMVAPGRVRLNRNLDDDPTIVETWI